MRRVMLVAGLVMFGAACASGDDAATDDTVGATAATQAMSDDPDASPEGASGVPAGFMGRVDRANQQLSDARYTEMPDGK